MLTLLLQTSSAWHLQSPGEISRSVDPLMHPFGAQVTSSPCICPRELLCHLSAPCYCVELPS